MDKNWFQCFVRDVREPEFVGGSKHALVHYMGWNRKWNEWLEFTPEEVKNPGEESPCKIAVRWTHTLRAHRSRGRNVSAEKRNPWGGLMPSINSGNDEGSGKGDGNKETNFAEKYWVQLTQLQAMGFTNFELNIAALIATDGNVQSAIESLVSS